MSTGKIGILGAGILLIWALSTRPARAMTSIEQQDTSDVPRESDLNASSSSYVAWESDFPTNDNVAPVMSDSLNTNIAAFLYTIRSCEHLFPMNVIDDSCYHIFYSGISGFNDPSILNQRFYGMQDHPVITGECVKVPLPNNVCQAAGLSAGCVSTAAGAYQIIRPTWLRIRSIEPALPDFSPASQDQAAVRILEECGALALLSSGDVNGALAKASKIWASLPGSTAKQHPKQLTFANDRFVEGLDRYA